ncbi:hypothetical protein BY458DRAFT_499578 [Sporodiniella umbellata]|nr:hypothetical protein BY458DRAFT_499578 [Sporodiniella umbellata]
MADIELCRYSSNANSSSSPRTETINSESINETNKKVTKEATNNCQSSKSQRKWQWLLWWNSEEWWSCWIGLVFFGCISSAVKHGIPSPQFLHWDRNPFMTFATPGNYGLLVIGVMMGAFLWLSMAATSTTNWKKFPLGYSVVFLVALISKILANNVTLHQASIGDSIWAIIFGCFLRNCLPLYTKSNAVPGWLKVALQTELYIAISLVLLCIDMSVLRPLAPRALFVSWLDTPTLFMVVAFFGWKVLKIDTQTSIIMSGATFICGSSAAIALGSSMGVPHKTEMPIAIISIFTIPSIIALPYIAKRMALSATVSGAWFGGCVDSTGAVIAAASIYGQKEAIDTSAVVKMMQNILIGPLSVFMAWAWSRYELQSAYKLEEELLRREEGLDDVHPDKPVKKPVPQEKPHILLWKRFPKFVLGFIITAVLFNTTIDSADTRSLVNSFCFYVSEWFSTLSFVSIGMGLQLSDMKKNLRSLGKLVTLYVVAQMVDIIITCLLAWVAFTFV